MKLITDTRERTPLRFQHLESVPGSLQTGDYSIQGLEHLFSIERKSIADLVQSVTSERKRFERELHRLRGFHFKRLLVIGSEQEIKEGKYFSKANPKAVLHSVYAMEARYDIPLIFSPTREAAALRVERWAFWYAREVQKNARRAETLHDSGY